LSDIRKDFREIKTWESFVASSCTNEMASN